MIKYTDRRVYYRNEIDVETGGAVKINNILENIGGIFVEILAYNNYKQGYKHDNLELEDIYYDIYDENIYDNLYETEGHINDIGIFVHFMKTRVAKYMYFTTDHRDEEFLVGNTYSQGRMDDVDTYLITGSLEDMVEFVCNKTRISSEELLRNI